MKSILSLLIVCLLFANSSQFLQKLFCSGSHEKWIPCKSDCIKDTCAYVGRPVSCLKVIPCAPGCVCEIGFARKNESGPCKPTLTVEFPVK
ncbi:hypothetical protein RR48_12151 [Papilio machaon]|uniref:TIL domain-containing protein n=1 Tax=Papilio machaon TaxID=76193 RepID=A0A194QS99_PAPMA|nr:hypothetical protein RR48_12151 [Papilio machaon]